ncbi:MAG: hypothetical protein ABI456_25415, partial [Ktedonobacteraceae bacterium]
RMQVGQSASNSGSRLRTIATVAIVLFALAGLMSGFVVGAMTHPRKVAAPPTVVMASTPVVRQNTTPTPTATQRPVALGQPTISSITTSETADGTTPYSVSLQVVDKEHNQPVHGPGLVCKLWLTKDGHVTDNIQAQGGAARLKSHNLLQDLQAPFQAEVPNALMFGTTTPQTQPCTADGVGNWTYSVAQGVDPGTYFLVVLVDWSGVHWKWTWQQIRIKKAG